MNDISPADRDARISPPAKGLTMTVEEIEAQVERIRLMASDDEAAHRAEDHLHVAVLKAISEGACAGPAACAASALKTRRIEFSRWCA